MREEKENETKSRFVSQPGEIKITKPGDGDSEEENTEEQETKDLFNSIKSRVDEIENGR